MQGLFEVDEMIKIIDNRLFHVVKKGHFEIIKKDYKKRIEEELIYLI